METKNIAVVVGNNISSMLGVIQSLGEKGVPVDACLVSNNKNDAKILKKSKYINDLLIITAKEDNAILDLLISKYRKASPKAILFTTGDYFASLIDREYNRVSEIFLMPYASVNEKPEQGRVTYLMDKSVQNNMAKNCGIITPKECVIELNKDDFVLDKVTYPCLAKPVVSCTGRKSEIKKCENQSELKKHLSKLKETDPNRLVLVQEFLDIQEEFILTGVCLGDIVYAPVLSRRLKVAQYKKGLTITGEIMNLDSIGEYKDNFMNLLKSFNYVGYFGMDVFLCKDGRIVFNEMNFRATGVIRGLTKAGFNVPYILYEYFVSGKELFDFTIKYGSIFFHDKIAWEEYIHNTLTKKELNHFIEICDFHTLQDDKDNGPYKEYRRYCFKKQIKNIWKK